MVDSLNFDFDPAESARQAVRDLLGGRRPGPWPLTEVQRALLRVLVNHAGREHPIRIADLIGACTVRTTEREVKEAMKSLAENFGILVGARRDTPAGYFLIVDREDRRVALRALIHEITSLARRVHAIEKNPRLEELLGQLSAELESA